MNRTPSGRNEPKQWAELTPHDPQHRLHLDNKQAWEAGKAVRIGHGPATVIGETP
jgi:hypothetical protein